MFVLWGLMQVLGKFGIVDILEFTIYAEVSLYYE